MNIYIPLPITAALLLLFPLPAAAEPVSGDLTPPPRGTVHRRPADHWIESIRKDNPAEYKRLKQLRDKEPDAFNAELRHRIQARAMERLLERIPRLREFLDSLPSDERESILHSLLRVADAGDTRRFQSRRDDRTDLPERMNETTAKNGDPHRPHESGKELTQAELESAYDRRTQAVEKEIERISLQLENLRNMLEERKNKRDRVISEQTGRRQRDTSRSK